MVGRTGIEPVTERKRPEGFTVVQG